jgi:TPR repeat protein
MIKRALFIALSVASITHAAEGDDPALAYRMGRYQEAVQVWRGRADAGETEAQYRLSQCLGRGIGIARDLASAMQWLTRAAEGGHPRAAYDLAMANDRPGGDVKAMVKWMRVGAERGVPEAQYNLATLLEEGDKIPRDLVAAYVWYRAASLAWGSLPDNEHVERVGLQLTRAQLSTAEKRVAEIIKSHPPAR